MRKAKMTKKIRQKLAGFEKRERKKEEKKQKGIARAKEEWSKQREAARWSSVRSYYL